MYEVAVLGSGLSGSLILNELHKRNKLGPSVALVSDMSVKETKPPFYLLHPIQGKKLQWSQLKDLVFREAVNAVKEHTNTEAHRMLRLVRSEVELQSLLGQVESSSFAYPSQLVPQLITRRELAEFSWLRDYGVDALQVGECYSVSSNELFTNLNKIIDSAGVKRVVCGATALSRKEDYWEVGLKDGAVCKARLVVMALGPKISLAFPATRFSLNAGELMLATLPFHINISVSGGGHIAPGGQANEVVIGSTYIHNRSPESHFVQRSSVLAVAELYQRATQFLAQPQVVTPKIVWSGTRVSLLPDRLPVLGEVGPGLHICTGFGSKGLFWVPYCAKCVVDNLEGISSIPDQLTASRVGWGEVREVIL